MQHKKIAIIGSCDPKRTEELDLKDVDETKQAGEKIGLALAEAEYDIVVYSSMRGIVGAAVRVLLNEFQGNSTGKTLVSLSQNVTVGLIAGVISALVFIGAQTSTLATLNLNDTERARQLKPFVLLSICLTI